MMMIVRCWKGNVRAMSRSSHRTVYEHGQAEIESVWGVKCDGTGGWQAVEGGVGSEWKEAKKDVGVVVAGVVRRFRLDAVLLLLAPEAA